MVTATIKFHIEADSYNEILEKSKAMISRLLDIELDQVLDRVSIELDISENEPINSDMSYAAEMTARLKNVR